MRNPRSVPGPRRLSRGARGSTSFASGGGGARPSPSPAPGPADSPTPSWLLLLPPRRPRRRLLDAWDWLGVDPGIKPMKSGICALAAARCAFSCSRSGAGVLASTIAAARFCSGVLMTRRPSMLSKSCIRSRITRPPSSGCRPSMLGGCSCCRRLARSAFLASRATV